MKIGIAFDLRTDFEARAEGPEDLLEEYDSPETVESIAAALRAAGHAVVLLGGGRAFVERVLREPPELVFNIAEGHGSRSREAHVPAVCELLRIPCTHSDPLTCALTLDKGLAKAVVAAAGLATPRSAVIARPAELAQLALAYPLIAKPLAEGSSIGVRRASRVRDEAALRALVTGLLDDYGGAVLVEEFCPGAELTVGLLGHGERMRALGVMEIAPRAGRVQDFVYSLEVKREFESEVEYRVPPALPPSLVERARELALGAARALGCRDVARVDLRIGADGEPQFLEVNPLPGLNPRTSDLVILARLVGSSHAQLVQSIAREAIQRVQGERASADRDVRAQASG